MKKNNKRQITAKRKKQKELRARNKRKEFLFSRSVLFRKFGDLCPYHYRSLLFKTF